MFTSRYLTFTHSITYRLSHPRAALLVYYFSKNLFHQERFYLRAYMNPWIFARFSHIKWSQRLSEARGPLSNLPSSFLLQIKGCHTFTFNNKDFGLKDIIFNRNHIRAFLTITAGVTEEATGITRSAEEKETTVVEKTVNLEFIETPDHFKPGLPFYGKVMV